MKHLIKIESTAHGVLGVRHAGRDQQYCEAGELVTLKWQPDAKWGLQEAHYTDGDGNIVPIDLGNGNGVVSFMMPDKNITINGTFKMFVSQDWTEGTNPSKGKVLTVGNNGEPAPISVDELANQITEGDNDLVDAIDRINPFKGWYTDLASLQNNHPSPQIGDYAYVKGAESIDPAAIYECTTAGTWSDSGRTADTSNVQTFASSEEVNEVHIVDDLDTGGVTDVLSAEQGKMLNYKSIKLTGITNDIAKSGITQVGDCYYNTSSKVIKRCTTWGGTPNSSVYQNVPFIDGAIYLYDNLIYVWDGTNLINTFKDVPHYPFADSMSVGTYDNCIIDISIESESTIQYNIGLFTLSHPSTGYYFRLAALNSDGTVDSSKGSNGVIASFTGTGTVPTGINKIVATSVSDVVSRAYMIVNFDLFPSTVRNTNYANPTKPRKIYPSIINHAADNITKRTVYNFTPASNEVVWDNLTYFPDMPWMKDFVVDMTLISENPSSQPICIGRIRFEKNGRRFITINSCSKSGIAPNDNASQMCLVDNGSGGHWTLPSEDLGGHRYETLSLVQKNKSGVYGSMKVDWAALPVDWDALSGSTIYDNYNVLNTLFSPKVYKIGSANISGANTINLTIDGVDAILETSSLYTPDGTPDWLMIISHGNGQGDNLPGALPDGTKGNKAWFDSHGISRAVIRTQDEESTPYTTNATGWGNEVCISRTIKLYNYLMEHYNFKKTVILAGLSMGGLTMGYLAYKKPFPIAFCLGCGPVPGVEIMFNNSSTTYKASIRAAYGMSADGSDDANIADFVKGYDWYKMGLIDLTTAKYKVGFPNFYLYYGNDSTFRNNFGGVAQYTEVYNALINGGSYSIMEQAGTTDVDGHATKKCYELAITDGVFERELGITY